jgi:valine--pyruvate aminotransferase
MADLRIMNSRFSAFANRFTGPTGTRLLMDDLGEVLAGDIQYCNLGGGNPAAIPAMQAVFRQSLARALADGSFQQISGSYDGPQGNKAFLTALRDLLRREYGWPVELENIAMTAGSQASFFILFNLFTGRCVDGVKRHIKLPLTPEYIGYADIAIEPNSLVAQRPSIEHLDERIFKYTVDFDHFSLDDTVGAVCISRPTNPTGNVLGAGEVERLVELTRTAGIPMIIDNAYGVPFPGIVFSPTEPVYDEHIVNCMSLSKLGLPGLRTGIVIANSGVIDAIRSINAIVNLATGSLGAVLTTDMITSGEILNLADNVIRPFYQQRVDAAVKFCARYLDGVEYFLHKPEGAIFLWLWFPGLPISAQILYERLKARRVLVIPGHYFFPGLERPWQHSHECIRISYAQAPEQVELGIRIVGEEVRRAINDT